LPVLRKDESLESLHPTCPGVVGEQLEKLRADAAPLVLIGHCEGNLGSAVRVPLPVVAGQTDHLPIEQGDQRHPIGIVDMGEELDFLRLQCLLDPEEAEIARLGPETLEELDQERAVVGLDRSDARPAPIAQGHVQFVLRWVSGHVRTLLR
jgi:hypothetical protein